MIEKNGGMKKMDGSQIKIHEKKFIFQKLYQNIFAFNQLFN